MAGAGPVLPTSAADAEADQGRGSIRPTGARASARARHDRWPRHLRDRAPRALLALRRGRPAVCPRGPPPAPPVVVAGLARQLSVLGAADGLRRSRRRAPPRLCGVRDGGLAAASGPRLQRRHRPVGDRALPARYREQVRGRAPARAAGRPADPATAAPGPAPGAVRRRRAAREAVGPRGAAGWPSVVSAEPLLAALAAPLASARGVADADRRRSTLRRTFRERGLPPVGTRGKCHGSARENWTTGPRCAGCGCH